MMGGWSVDASETVTGLLFCSLEPGGGERFVLCAGCHKVLSEGELP